MKGGRVTHITKLTRCVVRWCKLRHLARWSFSAVTYFRFWFRWRRPFLNESLQVAQAESDALPGWLFLTLLECCISTLVISNYAFKFNAYRSDEWSAETRIVPLELWSCLWASLFFLKTSAVKVCLKCSQNQWGGGVKCPIPVCFKTLFGEKWAIVCDLNERGWCKLLIAWPALGNVPNRWSFYHCYHCLRHSLRR